MYQTFALTHKDMHKVTKEITKRKLEDNGVRTVPQPPLDVAGYGNMQQVERKVIWASSRQQFLMNLEPKIKCDKWSNLSLTNILKLRNVVCAYLLGIL